MGFKLLVVLVVLDHDHRVPLLDQSSEDLEQPFDRNRRLMNTLRAGLRG